ncbi:molybdenum cofactor biosynthesis protein MoaE [Paenibacillus sp. NEAU-GSW1]|uniref:molybdenum cofactor biosynthesis protein n=1 Tax=Paenibacillus sp. NEAU-GSW1 TaxID=2682486 RepID=UPI0012E2C193|nr:molybdenum cofactor biosynthesis protein MoaE [Paenibacillus sp. NEAU-GSW1]MUT64442.1 molybdopterin converting factor [Paenibacillus sp. NEAU-GSW1]
MEFNWTIQLFAGLPERFGASRISFAAEEQQMTAAQLKQLLADQYKEHADLLLISFVACNQTYASDDSIVRASDELALLPPVSGGEPADSEPNRSSNPYVITDQAIDSNEVLAKVITADHGAALAFVGTTREWTHGKRTVRLEYEAYEPMAVKMMASIGEELAERWPGTLCAITHRIGAVGIAETSVVIAVSSPHRESCYEASRYAIERLKQIVPIWKKEIWEDGSEWKGHQLGPWKPNTPLEGF